jgi:hypothetical protein
MQQEAFRHWPVQYQLPELRAALQLLPVDQV